MKYVMLATTAGQKIPIIFPDNLTHSIMAQLVAAAIEVEMNVKAAPVSAGFIGLGLGAEVHGESETLRLSSRPSDAARVMVGESLSFMPDQMAEDMLDRLREAKSSGERSDNAVAIGEHAFRAGFRALHAALGARMSGQEIGRLEDKAWSDYDPPEDIKALA